MKRFFDCYIPVTTCNLRCHYCYITLNGVFRDKLPAFKYSPSVIGEALSQTRLGGICHFNFCGGGETMLPPEITPMLRAILEQGHYIMVVTNGTIMKRFDEIVQFPKELLDRLGFKFSFQYLELRRLNLIEKWFHNIKRVRAAGCSISVELTPNDEIIPSIEEIKGLCMEHLGALCHVTIARDSRNKQLPILTNLSYDDYKNTWGIFNSPMFDFKLSTFNVKRKEFCYAGLWSGYINIGNGEMGQCYRSVRSQNIFDDIDVPIDFMPIGRHCLEPHCFNSHAWLTMGLIPSLDTPAYSIIRDRKCSDGTFWLTDSMRNFLGQKLYDNNEILDADKQRYIDTDWKKRRIAYIFKKIRTKTFNPQ